MIPASMVAIRISARFAAVAAFIALALACAAPRAAAQYEVGAPISIGVHLATSTTSGQEIDDYTRQVGARPEIVMVYGSWNEPFLYFTQLRAMAARNVTPLLTWDPVLSSGGVPLRDIVRGKHDDYIRESAKLAVEWGKPLYVRFAHEMNLAQASYGPGRNGNRPEDFVATWRHIVRIFNDEGATNVSWVWSPNVHCGGRCPFIKFFPGDRWIDWVGLDGYNYAEVTDVKWFSFTKLFGRSYDLATRLSQRPVMVPETASTEDGGDKAAWIRSAFLSEIPTRFPRIRAVIWFNKVKETNWRVDSSGASLEAWREVVRSTLYNDAVARRTAAAPVPPDSPAYFHCLVFGGTPAACGTRGGYRNLATRSRVFSHVSSG